MRSLGLRLGIPVAVGWIIAIVIPSWIPKAIAGVLTVAILAIVIWAIRFANKIPRRGTNREAGRHP